MTLHGVCATANAVTNRRILCVDRQTALAAARQRQKSEGQGSKFPHSLHSLHSLFIAFIPGYKAKCSAVKQETQSQNWPKQAHKRPTNDCDCDTATASKRVESRQADKHKNRQRQ